MRKDKLRVMCIKVYESQFNEIVKLASSERKSISALIRASLAFCFDNYDECRQYIVNEVSQITKPVTRKVFTL